jgi:hypothetical protein
MELVVYLFNNSTQIIIKISIDLYFDKTTNLVDNPVIKLFPYFDLQKRLMFHHIKSRFAPHIEMGMLQ